ncbi:aromatic ring-opening dioxygenase catalytic subunit (LigB family) [Pseudoduganella flava]|uniref:Dioxygenase n=1 Tax=Pseudoduganella flava TaxID=871742 RepID=A0A562Q4R0_9BURK|nr:class III extradiol ring-cleavage dioxygenase [Pseudoduganella flava]QGZ41718.1 dioxygenase [Pseudoduganella flava]TWI51714.1 aromatic ring-opening dioxygenase catalytic subunit (LigB family) [Pseudoduganella flava]
MTSLPTYFLSHGGGPWPWMKTEFGSAYDVLEASLRDIPRQLGGKPRAVLAVTAHWEGAQFLLSSGAQPGMIYDYGGFPPHTYQIRYPAPGSPELAAQARELLAQAGIAADLDAQRGFDHGTFSALYPVFPDADVPIVQLSLQRGLDPQQHLAAGRALRPLREQGVLIVGSGLSYHNLRAFNGAGAAASHQFDGWLRQAMALPPAERALALANWEQAPSARAAHPREEHLLPMMVALGAAEEAPATVVYHEDDFFGALAVTSFRFG